MTKWGKGMNSMSITDSSFLPITIYIDVAQPHKVTLVEETLEASVISYPTKRLIGDKVYDNDPLACIHEFYKTIFEKPSLIPALILAFTLNEGCRGKI